MMNAFKIWLNVSTSPASPENVIIRCFCLSAFKVLGMKFVDKVTAVNQDLRTEGLKSASDTYSILCNIQNNTFKFNNQSLLQTLRSLFTLQKYERSQIPNEEIIQNPGFKILCQNLKSQARAIELNDTIDAMKILLYLSVPVNANIIQIMLQLIAKQVNDLSLQQIIFLDFLLKDFEHCPLIEALKIAFPIVFEAHLETKSDLKNITQLSDLLHFASRKGLSQHTFSFLIRSVLNEANRLDFKNAKSIVQSICEFPIIDEGSILMLHRALDIIVDNKSKCLYSDFDILLSKLAGRFSQKNLCFYHENFLHSATNFIVENQCSFEEGVWILKKASKFGYINIELLDYLSMKAERVPSILDDCGTLILFSFVGGLSLADYRPYNWSVLEPSILNNAYSHLVTMELPWVKFVRDLCTLDCWPLKLFDRIFNSNFLDKYLSRDYNRLDYLQLLSVHQAVSSLCPWYSGSQPPDYVLNRAMEVNGANIQDYPLKLALEKGLGGEEFVLTGLYTKMGHFIDHVILIKEGCPVKVERERLDGSKLYIDEIELPEYCKMIAVLYLPASSFCVNTQRLKGPDRMRISTLEVVGPSLLPISSIQWLQLLDKEKIPYLMQKIKESCEKIE